MKTQSFKKLMLLGLTAGLAGLFSCGEDEAKTPLPVADFTFTLEGKTVTVVNASTDVETQTWDFGDGATSTDLNPSHTYEANGSYIVKLTVTNETGSDDKSAAIEIINIAIDGDFSDWDDIPASISYSDGEGGIALELKLENLEDDKLFGYIKTSSEDNTRGFVDLYINSDNNSETGFNSWYWGTTPGFDLLIEGFLTSESAEAGFFFGKFVGTEPTAFSWEQLTPSSTFLVGSEQKNVPGGKAFEFSIALSEFPEGLIPTSKLKIGMDFIYTVETWEPLKGTLPQYGQEESAAFEYTLKLQ